MQVSKILPKTQEKRHHSASAQYQLSKTRPSKVVVVAETLPATVPWIWTDCPNPRPVVHGSRNPLPLLPGAGRGRGFTFVCALHPRVNQISCFLQRAVNHSEQQSHLSQPYCALSSRSSIFSLRTQSPTYLSSLALRLATLPR